MNDKIEEQPPKKYGSDANIVKQTAKELGMTQKELAAHMGVAENTIGNWARGIVDTPEWAIKMFDLLKTEKKFNTIKHIISDEIGK
jgi:DNA-binding XRE family transcriptional regulator